MIKKYYIYILLSISFFYGCQLDPLTESENSSFNKLFAVSENVEAVDFICKPDLSGYIILGNLKNDENSDIILIDVGPDGMQRNLHRISTQFFDEGVKLKINEIDNSLIILGHRRNESSEVNVFQNILIKADLDGIPVKAENALPEDSVSAEIKIITDNQNTPYQLNDFLLIPPHLITVGNIRQSSTGNFNRITRIYDWNTINFSDTSDADILMTRQKPSENNNQIPYNGSRNLKILKGTSPNSIYAVYGHSFKENPNGAVSGPSNNISWDIYSSIESNASEPIFIGTDNNEAFGNVVHHSNGKTYIGGYYSDPEQDSLFLITKEYRGKDNNTDQKPYTFNGYGTKISSLAEDDDRNVVMATIEEGSLNNISYLLKFSPAGVLIEDENFVFSSTGFNNIKKIECEPNNIVVVLSQKIFENNSTAIGLMKIKF
jgi:hypothetical protein